MKATLVALVVTVVVAGMATPDYDPWRDPISRLASDGQPHALVVRAALALVAVALFVRARRQPGATGRLLTIAAAAGLVIALAPKDLPGTTPSTLASQVHVVAAVVGGAAIVTAMCLARTKVAIAGAVATVVLAVVFQRSWGTGVYGAVERALVAVPLAWCTTLR